MIYIFSCTFVFKCILIHFKEFDEKREKWVYDRKVKYRVQMKRSNGNENNHGLINTFYFSNHFP